MSTYTNKEKVEGYLQRTLTAEEEALLPAVIQNVSEQINTYTNRSWGDIGAEENPEETTRYYDSNGHKELFIDDVLSVSSVQFLDYDGLVMDSALVDDYMLYPLNATYKNSIFLRYGRFPRGGRRVAITGVFSSGALPIEVEAAATAMVGDYFSHRKDKQDGKSEFKRETIEGYSYERAAQPSQDETTQTALASLAHLRKIVF